MKQIRCGKYFGKHDNKDNDFDEYPGNGTYWRNHLRSHEIDPLW